MRGSIIGLVSGKLLQCLIAALAVLLLLLPSFGPVLDHHFAEWEPYHEHIYLGSTLPKHLHSYEMPRSHGQKTAAPASGNTAPDSSSPDGIVYLTSYDGIGETLTFPVFPLLHLALVFPELENNQFVFNTASNDRIPSEAFIAPPKKPPRI
jgi:hypothetical protein